MLPRPLRVIGCLPLLCTLLLYGLMVPCAQASFSVSGRKILNGGAQFVVRGVCYHPRPIGMETSAMPSWGDFFTGEYSTFHERDLPRLRAMGANTVRVYGWTATGAHQSFLDKCYNGGADPIFVIVNQWVNPESDWSSPAVVDALCAQYVALEDTLAGHPAVLALAIGNENNAVVPSGKSLANGANPSFWAAMDRVAAAIKTRNPSRLVTVPSTDALAQVSASDANLAHIDFWSLQIYRGDNFGSLFSDFEARSKRPLVLTEFGMDAFDHAANTEYPNNGYRAAQALSTLWQEIAAARSVCAGACVFEYLDEWGKVGSAATHDAGPFAHAGFPDGYMDEEWWGLFSVSKLSGAVDAVQARAAVVVLGGLWQAELAKDGAGEGARLINISTRAKVGTGEAKAVVGFIVQGNQPRLLLVRAVGPTLAGFQVKGAIADPILDIYGAGQDGVMRLVASNDNWEQVANLEQLKAATASHTGFSLSPGSKDAAWLGLFMPGAYTVEVYGAAGGEGVALAEVYEVR